MKVEFFKGDLKCVCEGSTPEIFQQLSDFCETFQDDCCGACKSKNIRFSVRTVEDNNFYELVCNDCWAKISFGLAKTGGKMYPKRFETDNKGKAVKDKDGKGVKLSGNGWVKYQKQNEKDE